MILWLDPKSLLAPHRVNRPEDVDALAEAFEHGWDLNCPALIGYEWEGRIQLLSGTHRRAAAIQAGILVPVVIRSREAVEMAWGTDDWAEIMAAPPAGLESRAA